MPFIMILYCDFFKVESNYALWHVACGVLHEVQHRFSLAAEALTFEHFSEFWKQLLQLGLNCLGMRDSGAG